MSKIFTTQNIHEFNTEQGVVIHCPWVFDE